MSEDRREREDKLDAGELNRKRISEKIQEGTDEKEQERLSKFSNFWYYNKWKVIIGLFVVIVVIICTVQMCSSREDDCMILYSGSYYLQGDDRSAINSIISSYLPYDFNNDKELVAGINVISVYSDEQVAALNEKVKTDSNAMVVNKSSNLSQLQSFDNIMMTGEYSICIIEPWLYERIVKGGGFRKLSDVLGSAPEKAYSEFALPLSETAVYRDNPGLFDGFTEDTLICLRTEAQLGNLFKKNKGSDGYKFAEEYFKSLVLGKKD